MAGAVATWVCVGAGAVPPPTAGAAWLAIACAGGGVVEAASAGRVAGAASAGGVAGAASVGGFAGAATLPSADALPLALDCTEGTADAAPVVSAALSVAAGWPVAG